MDRLTPDHVRRMFTVTATALVLAAGPATHPATHPAAAGPAPQTAARPAARTVSYPNVAEPARSGDPLGGGAWGVNDQRGNSDQDLWAAYAGASGTTKTLLGRAALQPRSVWFHSGTAPSDIGTKVSEYIHAIQQGDPNVLVPMAFFRLWPHHESGKNIALTAADQAAYKTYMANAAKGIGSSRASVILEPDFPVSLTGWSPSTRAKLVKYAAQRFGALPATAATYIDAGDSDWLSVDAAVKLLISGGIQYVRGFALGATHYTSVPADLAYGHQVVSALKAAGYPGKHFVIDTADNGQGFTFAQYKQKHPTGNHDNVEPCTSYTETVCDALGIPPTPVTWTYPGLSTGKVATAKAYCDGYLWYGRPWLINQASPFSSSRTIAVARYQPKAFLQ